MRLCGEGLTQRRKERREFKNMFTEKNIQQIKNHGLSEEKIINQLHIFKNGIPFATIAEAASAGKGIEVLSEKQQNDFASLFDSKKK